LRTGNAALSITESSKWFVAATAGRWQVCGIDAAHRADYPVLGIDGDEEAPGLAKCDARIVADIHDIDGVLDQLSSLHLNPGGCLSIVSDVGMPLAGAIQDEYGLVGPGKQISRRMTDKGQQRTRWRDAFVENRQFAVCDVSSDAEKIATRFPLPFMVKPVDSAGSRGVTRVDARDQITTAIRHAFAFSKSKRIIIEEFIAGTEFAVEVFRCEGTTHVLAISEKTKVQGTSGTVAAEYRTAELDDAEVSNLQQLITDALDALEYRDGVGHVEIMRTPTNDFGLIEVAGRGGGFMVFEGYVPLVSGIDLAELAVRQAMGEAIEMPTITHRPGVLRFLPARTGKVIDWQGLDAANSLPGVTAQALVKKGELFSAATTDGDRVAYILATGDSVEHAVERVDRAEQIIQFSFHPA
jgi:formate-dependent phosphoribosylglycinamide formyltransferase (GAR transformylase)